MAGTIIGTLTVLTHLIRLLVLSIFYAMGFGKESGGELPLPDEKLEIYDEILLFRSCLVLLSNIFFIEWAI